MKGVEEKKIKCDVKVGGVGRMPRSDPALW